VPQVVPEDAPVVRFKIQDASVPAVLREGHSHVGKAVTLHEAFKEYVESMHGSFERLTGMEPVTIATVPKDAPSECIYLFSEGSRPLYVGRTRHLRQRLRQHSIPGAQHNQAVFAFRLAREKTGQLTAAYSTEGSRVALSSDSEFGPAFLEAKRRIREMQVRYVEERDPLRQALLEIYVAVVLKTPYNDFNTH
jgi:predicted GIY-YIG superfamily endonuclease